MIERMEGFKITLTLDSSADEEQISGVKKWTIDSQSMNDGQWKEKKLLHTIEI